MASVLRLAVIAAAGVALAIGGHTLAVRWHPAPARYPLQGVDLGEQPRRIEWASIRAAGADFAYVVATEGTGARDPGFEANWSALPDAGLRRGAVHLYSLCEDGAAQADAFNATVPRTADALPAAVDVDRRDGCDAPPAGAAVIESLRAFLGRVETHTGKPVILRLSRWAERRYALSSAFDRPLWLTGNFLRPGYADRAWRLWRASDMRRVDGVEGPVNWDVVAP
ncbi:glycoside hydrolase family 25 protein [Sphingomonas sp.]|uniref:glycoside hydrolase family 25 protein n=1 Tax=Sphingomonas sp. TaxID=28214 RepID=UPI003CC513A8